MSRLELARAQGADALHVPRTGPYRRRWENWESALLYCGCTPEQVTQRFDPAIRALATTSCLSEQKREGFVDQADSGAACGRPHPRALHLDAAGAMDSLVLARAVEHERRRSTPLLSALSARA